MCGGFHILGCPECGGTGTITSETGYKLTCPICLEICKKTLTPQSDMLSSKYDSETNVP